MLAQAAFTHRPYHTLPQNCRSHKKKPIRNRVCVHTWTTLHSNARNHIFAVLHFYIKFYTLHKITFFVFQKNVTLRKYGSVHRCAAWATCERKCDFLRVFITFHSVFCWAVWSGQCVKGRKYCFLYYTQRRVVWSTRECGLSKVSKIHNLNCTYNCDQPLLNAGKRK